MIQGKRLTWKSEGEVGVAVGGGELRGGALGVEDECVCVLAAG